MNRKLFLLSIVCLAGVFLAGCAGVGETIEQTTAWRNHAHETKTTTQSQLDDLVIQRETFPDGSQQADLIDAAIARAQTKISALNAAVVHADLVLAEASNPSDGLTRVAGGIIPYIPAPIQAPVLLGAALLATLVRSQQLKSGTKSIIQSIQHALDHDESFKAAFAINADTIRTIQTPLARKLVDKAQRA